MPAGGAYKSLTDGGRAAEPMGLGRAAMPPSFLHLHTTSLSPTARLFLLLLINITVLQRRFKARKRNDITSVKTLQKRLNVFRGLLVAAFTPSHRSPWSLDIIDSDLQMTKAYHLLTSTCTSRRNHAILTPRAVYGAL
jgi:hypothetical protein